MARYKEKVSEQVQTPDDDDEILDKTTVYSVLEFARGLAGALYPTIMTPDLINARVKDVSYLPTGATTDSLFQALSDPKEHESDLRNFVEYYENLSSPIRRIISYMASLLSFNLQYVVINAEKGEYTTSKFKKDEKIVFDFLDKFDWHYHFRNVVKQILRNEVFIGSVREDGRTVFIQELPIQYCKITGRWDYGFLADLNFYMFLQPGCDINGFSPFFRRKMDEIFSGENAGKKYNPLMRVESRGESVWTYWCSLPPEEGFVFKLDPSLNVCVPYLAALLPEFIDQSVMRSLQKDINFASATKMLAGTIPLLKEQGAKISNALALDPKMTGQFLSLVKSALNSAVKVAAAPLENMQAISFDGNPTLYDDYLRTGVATSGLNSSLFYNSKIKQNSIESQLSFQSDCLFLEQNLYPQFSSFLNYFVNKKTNKYKYKFIFSGDAYYLDKQQKLDILNRLSTNGIVLPQMYANILDLKPQDFMRMLEQSQAIGFVDNFLTPLIPAFQQSSAVGRPRKEDIGISDSGLETHDNASNIGRGGVSV